MLDTDIRHLHGLRDESSRALAAALGPCRDVALVDVPNQINVGDSLIWAGEMAYLRALGVRVRYVSDLHGYEPRSLRRALGSGAVLIHGGGNFGDLWLGHQAHRERVARDLPDHRIVQLPQSVYFQSRERAAEANRILGAHRNFHLLARDRASLARAATDLPDVVASFCHDMAFGWDAPAWTAPTAGEPRILVIARADRESASGLNTLPPDWLPGARLQITDWGELGLADGAGRRARRVADAQHRIARLARRVPPLRWPGLQAPVRRSLAHINADNIAAGVGLYDTAAAAMTDRLHAHVIAALRGVPHVLLDNSYGKLTAVYDASSHGFSTAHRATTLDEARELLLRLRA